MEKESKLKNQWILRKDSGVICWQAIEAISIMYNLGICKKLEIENMKRILFVLPSLAMGGLEKVQVTLANALVDKEYDVTVMILQPQRELESELDERVHLIYREPKQHIMKNVPYIRHKFYDDGMWETRASARTLYKYYVGKEKFDVEIAFFRGLAVKIISGSTNHSSVKLAWVHSDFKQCAGIQSNFKDWNAVKDAYNKFHKIVCVSKQACNSFVEVIGANKSVKVVYNVLPNTLIKNKSMLPVSIEHNKFTIMSVGRLTKAKGYERLLQIVKRLTEEGYLFDLWLIGSGEEEKNLKQYVEQEQLQNVLFLGKNSNPYAYMKKADLYVCSSEYEGYNLTVAEAMLCGLPVLSTACAGPSEILDNGKYGVLVENSTDGLYEGIKRVLDQPEVLEWYRLRTQEREHFFNGDVILREIIELFSEKDM